MKKALLSLTILAALIAGCAPKPVPAEPTADLNVVVGTMMAATLTALAPTPAPPTETPAPEPTPTEMPPGTIIEEFGEGFTFPNANWSEPYEATNPTGEVKHAFTINAIPDSLQINLPEAETYVYTFYNKEMPADVSIEAGFVKEGKNYSEAAVACRVNLETKEWYEFRVNHLDATAVIYYFHRIDVYKQPYQNLASAKIPVQLFADTENRIHAICQGSKLTLMVNDIEAVSVEDTKLTGAGLVGVGGFVHNQTPLNINFGYFRVSPAG